MHVREFDQLDLCCSWYSLFQLSFLVFVIQRNVSACRDSIAPRATLN